ncbi:unnamed protein product [Choristocarpus tenellus]
MHMPWRNRGGNESRPSGSEAKAEQVGGLSSFTGASSSNSGSNQPNKEVIGFRPPSKTGFRGPGGPSPGNASSSPMRSGTRAGGAEGSVRPKSLRRASAGVPGRRSEKEVARSDRRRSRGHLEPTTRITSGHTSYVSTAPDSGDDCMQEKFILLSSRETRGMVHWESPP